MRDFETTLNTLNQIPESCLPVLVMRHSVRFQILSAKEVYFAGVTEEGLILAQNFGRKLSRARPIGRILSTPVRRCVDTAVAVASGAGWKGWVQIDNRISHGFGRAAWHALPICYPNDPLPQELRTLFGLAFDQNHRSGLVDIFVTHDTIVGALAGYFYCEQFSNDNWPDFLEGVWVWQENDQAHLIWREQERKIPLKELVLEHGLNQLIK